MTRSFFLKKKAREHSKLQRVAYGRNFREANIDTFGTPHAYATKRVITPCCTQLSTNLLIPLLSAIISSFFAILLICAIFIKMEKNLPLKQLKLKVFQPDVCQLRSRFYRCSFTFLSVNFFHQIVVNLS